MNKKKIFYFEIGCLIFCFIFSFINHFLYEWTNNCLFLASFVPINESVWEHAKLLFFPFLFFSLFEYFFFLNEKNFIFAKSLALIISVPLMIILFYTYSGIIGTHCTVIDILIAIIVTIFMNLLSYKLITDKKEYKSSWIVIFVLIYIILFAAFTFYPPKIPLFLDTLTGEYGI